MSVLEQKDELIDKPTDTSLTERVTRANSNKPVKNDPDAATSIADFVTNGNPAPDEEGEDVAVVSDPAAALARKNAKSEADRKAGVVPKKKA